jgi:hypothetical protein
MIVAPRDFSIQKSRPHTTCILLFSLYREIPLDICLIACSQTEDLYDSALYYYKTTERPTVDRKYEARKTDCYISLAIFSLVKGSSFAVSMA